VEDSVHNTKRVIWTNYNVLWTQKFSSNISNNDEKDFIGLNTGEVVSFIDDITVGIEK